MIELLNPPLYKPQVGHTRLKQGYSLNQGLVGWWLMNEGGGLKVYDLSGKGNHGTLTNGPTWGTGQIGGATTFDGVDDYIATGFNQQLNDFTVCMWFKSTGASIATQRLLDKVYDTGFWMGQSLSNGVNYWGGGVLEVDSPYGTYIALPSGIWHQICMTRSGTTKTIYGDGGSVQTSSTVSSAALSANNLTIGGPGIYFTGQIDEVRIYNRALSAAEILSLYSDPLAALDTPPIIIWAPNAGSGAQNLTPSLVTNTSSFYAATITAGSVGLIPGLFTNSNSFYSPTVAVGTVNLTPSLFTNSNSFYSHVVSLASGPQTLLPTLFTNSSSFYSVSVTTGSVNLTPLLFTNSNSFYSPTISLGGVSLLPSLLSNTNSFYAPTVSPGLVNLVASLFTNSNTFYGHTVAQPSLQNLTPNLYSNSQAFYTHTISAGTTFSAADLAAIADAVWAHPRALTVDKFLGLK